MTTKAPVYRRKRDPIVPENIAAAVFGTYDIVDIIADFIEHNQIVNVLRGLCRWTRHALAPYRGYSLIDYFVHCRLHFQTKLWALITREMHDGSKYRPTCGYGIRMDRIATKIYQSILDYDAAEYARICHMYLSHKLAEDVISRDKWRLFAATAGESGSVDIKLRKWLPYEIIRRLPQICIRPVDDDNDDSNLYVADIMVYKYIIHKRKTTYERIKRRYHYPIDYAPELLYNTPLNNSCVHEHAKLFIDSKFYNSLDALGWRHKIDILTNRFNEIKYIDDIICFAKFIYYIMEYRDVYNLFNRCLGLYNFHRTAKMSLNEFVQFVLDYDMNAA
ncbi:hypothetical protein F-M6_0201 [Faustovirus]|nr:hypothetical protein F-M6_0201 [Faustovirus]